MGKRLFLGLAFLISHFSFFISPAQSAGSYIRNKRKVIDE